MQNEQTYQDPQEVEPVESAQTEITRVLDEGDPDLQVAILEKKAALAPRYAAALSAILVAHTFPEDWKIFGTGDDAKACLSSAGAERVARQFGIKIFEVTHKKEEFTDGLGAGYRYVFEGKATMADRVIYAQGIYSTRDKFLGFKDSEFKALENINENDIRDAAFHIFSGNAIKALLGLRGIPAARLTAILNAQGADAKKTGSVRHGSGTQGGTSADDSGKQKELAELLLEMANAGFLITVSDEGVHGFDIVSEIADPLEVAKDSCAALTAFIGKDKTLVKGIPSAKSVKGKRLEIALRNAKTLWAEKDKENGN
jgi:hypothetical protein